MRRRKYGKYLPTLMTLIDFFLVNVVFTAYYFITRDTFDYVNKLRLIFVLVNFSFIPAYLIFYPIHRQRTTSTERLLWASIEGVTVSALILFGLVIFLGRGQMPFTFYLTFYATYFIVFPIVWLITLRVLKSYRRRGVNVRNVVIIGAEDNAIRLYKNLLADDGYGMRVQGFFSDDQPAKGINYLGTLDELEEYCRSKSVDAIFFTLPGSMEDEVKRAIHVANNIMAQFYFVPAISRHIKGNFQLESINSSVPTLSLHPSPLQNVFKRALKRVFDIVFSLVILIILLPLVFLPVAIAIKLTSPGPVFFRQKRTGYKGNEFTCYKFRTMKVNNDADSRQATKNDDRTTRIGEFLRRTSIDELPQFFNVLTGDMSVVGPRPHMLLHTETYRQLIDQYMIRHLVKPGITGWAQVNGFRGNTDKLWKMEKRVDYDVWYIEHWSFMLDIRIIYRTITNALRGEENAY